MKRALDRYVIRGPRHNVNFLRDVLENKRFNSGNLSTKFIPEEYPNGFKGHQYTDAELQDLIASVAVMHFRKAERKWDIDGKLETALPSPLDHWFLSIPGGKTYEVQVLGIEEDNAVVSIDGKEVSFAYIWDLHEPLFEAHFGDRVVVTQPLGAVPNGYRMQHVGSEIDVQVWDDRANQLRKFIPPKQKKDMSKMIVSPMPGTVVSVDVNVGDKVFAGQGLAILEAMKMQNVLRAPKDTVIKAIHVKKGNEVAVDQVLIEFTE